MTADIRIVPARPAHVRTIARRMRSADVEEIRAASGKTSGQALSFSLRKSSSAWTVMIDGRPEIMFGVGDISVLAGVGAPWLLGTDEVERHYVAFARQSVNLRDQLLARYPVLRNVVDERNRVSIRWLRWLGCSFSEPIDLGGHPFRLFEFRAGPCAN